MMVRLKMLQSAVQQTVVNLFTQMVRWQEIGALAEMQSKWGIKVDAALQLCNSKHKHKNNIEQHRCFRR